MSSERPVRVGYVLSYPQTNYVRTEALLAMLGQAHSVEVYRAMNTSKGLKRYAETLWRLLKLRLTKRPDVYILGFRGYDVYWPVRLLTVGRPLVFDEFINPYLWFVEEHRKFAPGSLPANLIKLYDKSMLATAAHVLSDTSQHADYSSTLVNVSRTKFTPLYVGTNEQLFAAAASQPKPNAKFTVFFYGNFLPLHGLDVIVAAARQLQGQPIQFVLIGGGNKNKIRHSPDLDKFRQQIKGLGNVEHKAWVDYKELPGYIAAADLCLGGPFGGTPQAQVVISGKTYQFLAMAKPTVVGRIDGDNGFVDKQNCLLVKQGSPDALADSIKWAYDHQTELKKIGQAGHSLYQQRFSVAAQAPILTELVRRLA